MSTEKLPQAETSGQDILTMMEDMKAELDAGPIPEDVQPVLAKDLEELALMKLFCSSQSRAGIMPAFCLLLDAYAMVFPARGVELATRLLHCEESIIRQAGFVAVRGIASTRRAASQQAKTPLTEPLIHSATIDLQEAMAGNARSLGVLMCAFEAMMFQCPDRLQAFAMKLKNAQQPWMPIYAADRMIYFRDCWFHHGANEDIDACIRILEAGRPQAEPRVYETRRTFRQQFFKWLYGKFD